eukprot:3432788-Pyramimonas_sp.AAC.1
MSASIPTIDENEKGPNGRSPFSPARAPPETPAGNPVHPISTVQYSTMQSVQSQSQSQSQLY